MSQVRIVEQNYFEFMTALRAAATGGARVESGDKTRWKAFVTANKVQEAAFKTLASKKYEDVKAVIIDNDGPWKGYYMYTTAEEACLKWVRED